MSWVVFALIAAFLVACSDVIDKFIVERYTKNAGAIIIFFGIMNLGYSVGIFLLFKVKLEFSFTAIIAIITGSMLALSSITRFVALVKEEVSRISPLFATTPLVIAVLAAFLLNESFSYFTYIGIAFIIAGAFLLSFRIEKGIPKALPVLGIVFIGILLLGMQGVGSSWVRTSFDIWTFISYNSLGYAMTALPLVLFGNYGKEFLNVFVKNPRALGSLFFEEIFSVTGVSILYYAFGLGPPTLVATLYSLKMFFVFLIATLVAIKGGNILREGPKGQAIFLKAAAIALIFVGVYLLTAL